MRIKAQPAAPARRWRPPLAALGRRTGFVLVLLAGAGMIPASGTVRAAAWGFQRARFGQRIPPPPRMRPAPRPWRQPRMQPPRAGRAGVWGNALARLMQYPPQERIRRLRRNPAFRRLPARRRRQMIQRLRRFNALPPAQQRRMLQRLRWLGRLTPAQRNKALQLARQFQQLPPQRRRLLAGAYQRLLRMPPGQRRQVFQKPWFQCRFTPQERKLLRQRLALPNE